MALLLIGGMACSSEDRQTIRDDRVHIITTIHPFATILRPIVGNAGRVSILLPGGGSPHTYSPRPSDIRLVSSGKVLVYGHHHLDGWAAGMPAPARIELFSLLPDSLQRPFPPVLTSQRPRPEGRDPHFWTDPLSVKALVPALTDRLCSVIPDGCPVFETNASRFVRHLDSLHHRIQMDLEPIRGKAVLLSTPFFQYFLTRYDIQLLGVIKPAADVELSPRQLKEIIETARAANVQAIFALPHLPSRSAAIVSESSRIPLYRLDPIGQDSDTATYDALLLENVRALLTALG